MPRRIVTIGKNDAGQRLDKFLTKTYPNLPQSVLYKCIRTKDVKRNASAASGTTGCRRGMSSPSTGRRNFSRTAPKEYDFLKAPKALSIVYEDENMMLLDKKPGLIVHPDQNYHFDSLIARVQHYLYDKGSTTPKGRTPSPGPGHRIDRNTGGIVLAAKNAEACGS